MSEDLAKQLKNACDTHQNEFKQLKLMLPKIDFKTYNECSTAMLRIIDQYRGLFLPDEYCKYYSLDILNIEPVESDMLKIDVACHDGGEYYPETITVPVKYFTDKDFFNQAVEEDKARRQAEAQKRQEELARKLADPEYQEYLRLRQKFS